MSEASVRLARVPDLEHRALMRISVDLQIAPSTLSQLALREWTEAGTPTDPACPPGALDEYSLRVWWAVRWWLRHAPALELVSPAKLTAELIDKMQAGDIAGATAAARQIGRIAADLLHPAQREAREIVRSMVGASMEGPERTQLLERLAQAERLAIGVMMRERGAETGKA